MGNRSASTNGFRNQPSKIWMIWFVFIVINTETSTCKTQSLSTSLTDVHTHTHHHMHNNTYKHSKQHILYLFGFYYSLLLAYSVCCSILLVSSLFLFVTQYHLYLHFFCSIARYLYTCILFNFGSIKMGTRYIF